MQTITQFDPTNQSGNMTFTVHLPNGGWMLLINESVVGLQLLFANTGVRATIPPFCMRMMRLSVPVETTNWSQAYVLTGSPSPINTVTGEVLEESEWTGGEFLIPLPRFVNIGNGVLSTTGTNNVVNDGNNAPTEVVEGTPSGAGSSQLKWNNDGSGLFGGGNDVVNNAGVFTSMALDAIPVGAIAGGALDTDVTVGAAQITGSINPKQITLDGVQADETLAGAGDLFIPHGIHIAGSILGAGGVVTVGDKIKASAGWDASTTFPGAQVSGDVATAQQTDSTNSGSTSVPQVLSGVAGAGVSVKATASTTLQDGTAGATVVEVYPTETNSQITTVQVDTITAAGVITAGAQLRTNSPVFGAPGQWIAAAKDNHTLGSSFSGTGAGTYSHFFRAKTPIYIGITSTELNSTQTVGVDTIASSNVHVNMPNNWPFVGIANLT